MPQLYLVTDSWYYYPSPGTDDWRLLTTDKEAAQAEFDRVRNEERHMGSTVALIELSDEGGGRYSILAEHDTDSERHG